MPTIAGADIRKVVVACDAGMGSSVMLASQMRKRLKKYDVAVEHVAVNSIPSDAQVVLTQSSLAARAQGIAPDAVVVPFQMFMGDPAFDKVEAAIRDGGTLGA
ncbi:MAG: mannitol system or component [Actinomycetota bacterium]|nr:mannitol system or component [Actinomycetota bacterium]MDQ1642917.1 mannitol system or component [Actinomycetota bacterium]